MTVECDKREVRPGSRQNRHPVRVLDRTGGVQHTIAVFNMYVGLPHNFKGTHMSRFVEILNSHEREISIENFPSNYWDMIVANWDATLDVIQNQVRKDPDLPFNTNNL